MKCELNPYNRGADNGVMLADRRRIAAMAPDGGLTTEFYAKHGWLPIQVKQMDKVGRPDIDQFEAVMHREDRQRGFFVSFGYSSDAQAECAAFHEKSGRIIKPINVQEIFDERHVQKM